MSVSINLVIKLSLIDLEMAQPNRNPNDLQLIIYMPIKLASILESDLIIKTTKGRFH